MDLGIAGRKAIVCASSRGLGRACATRLAEAGCEVVINGLDKDRLADYQNMVAQLQQFGTNAIASRPFMAGSALITAATVR